uniref:Uncharacterized protein n=1 Tax=Sus scrofa TaxID=9823 RepID=A0A8D1BSP6_PIG
MNSLISLSSFCVEHLGFLCIVSCHLYRVTVLPLFFKFGYLFFVCPIAMTRTSNTMLNKSGESGHPCLVPGISGKAFSFAPLSIIFVVGLS